MSDGSVIIDTKLDKSGFESGVKSLTSSSESSFKKLGSIASSGLKTTIKVITKATEAIAGLAGASIAAGIQFESAFTGVTKTVDATEDQFYNLSNAIRNMSKQVPESASAISEVAETAGQLGIGIDNIEEFTKVMVELGDTTNLSCDLAASSLAKFANITGMSLDDVDRLGACIVDLGNHFATTEQDIVSMAERLAGVGTQVGLNESQIMGFATALSSVGIEAEMGGSAFSKAFVKMQTAVVEGGDSLNRFAEVANMSSEDFKKAFEDDAANAMISFLKGLGSCEEKGENAILVLDELGMSEVRLRDTMLRASNASGVFSDAVQTANEAWDSNTALTIEAEKRYATMESQLKMLKNSVVDLGISFYKDVNNPLISIVKTAKEMVNRLSSAFNENGLEGLVESIGNVLADAITRIARSAPEFINAGVNLLENLIDGLNKNSDRLGKSAIRIVQALSNGIITLAPKMAELGINLISKLVEGMAGYDAGASTKILLNNLYGIMQNIVKSAISLINNVITPLSKVLASLSSTLKVTVPLITAFYTAMKAYTVITSVVNAIKAFEKANEAATVAQAALNAVCEMNPYVLLASAIVGLVTAIGVFIACKDDETEKMSEATEKAKEQAQAYNDLKESINENIDAHSAEMDHYSELANELETLIDDNGKVKEAYKDRANFIINELNNAFNLELAMNDGVITKNGEVVSSYEQIKDAINNTIQAKKAQVILEDLEEGYRKAITETAGLEVEIAEKKIKYNELVAKSKKTLLSDDERKQLKDLEEQISSLTGTCENYYNTIQDYEDNATLYAGGNYNEIFDNYNKKLKEQSNYTSEQLEGQGTVWQDWNRKRAEQNGELITVNQQAGAQIVADTKENNRSLIDSEEKVSQRIEDSVTDTNHFVEDAKRGSNSTVESEFRAHGDNMANIASENGDKVVNRINNDVNSKIQTAINNCMAGCAKAGYNSGFSVGANILLGVLAGMDSKLPDLNGKSGSIITSSEAAMKFAADIHSPSRLFRDQIGKNIVKGVEVGIDLQSPDLYKKVKSMVSEMSEFDIDALYNKMNQIVVKSQDSMSAVATNTNSVVKNQSKTTLVNKIKGTNEVVVNLDGKEIARGIAPYQNEFTDYWEGR